ncbi:MAG: DNA primase regulatory subunit PriL [Halobacteriaceae archaeon]
MDRLHARYPFLSGAREAVEQAGVDLAAVVADEEGVVRRARERVESAVADGTTGDPHRDTRTELLSYPVARVLVSLTGEPALVERYARAEAATARSRFAEDFDAGDRSLRSVERRRLSLADLLADFEMSAAVTDTGDGYEVAVGTYLALAVDLDGERWRLTDRRLRDGRVPVAGDELPVLLEEAVADRVSEGLPLSVPDAVADPLGGAVADLRDALGGADAVHGFDVVVPGLFPPCVRALLDAARGDEDLPPHSTFALAGFLAATGLDGEEATAMTGRRDVGRRTDALRAGDGAQYAPPSCETMQAYGDCVDPDETCEDISHPLEYYDVRLEEADRDALADWRVQRSESQ